MMGANQSVVAGGWTHGFGSVKPPRTTTSSCPSLGWVPVFLLILSIPVSVNSWGEDPYLDPYAEKAGDADENVLSDLTRSLPIKGTVWKPPTVTICTSEYRPFLFPREDYALTKYLRNKVSWCMKTMAALLSLRSHPAPLTRRSPACSRSNRQPKISMIWKSCRKE